VSHVVTLDVEIRDLEALRDAAAALGLEFREGQQTFRWWGKHVGDYALPAGFTAEDMGKCEHAISLPNNPSAYEVGVVRRRDGRPGFSLMFDFYGGGKGLMNAVGSKCGRLVQEYAAQVVVKQAGRNWRVTRTQAADGALRLTLHR
jgi:hypothetical protein